MNESEETEEFLLYLWDNFLQFSIKTCSEYSLEVPQRGTSNESPQQ